MEQKQKLELLRDAYVSKEVKDERKKITVLNNEVPKEFHDAIRDIQFKLNDETGTFELDYEIMSDACNIIANLSDKTDDELKDADFYELANDTASVYTYTRLQYLNANNQEDVSEKMKEYGCDIVTACAVWYDDMVTRACELIRDYILE